MVTIDVKRYLNGSYFSNDDGNVLFKEIEYLFNLEEKVNVSFEGISGLNSSFVNSAFIQLLNDFTFEFIKDNLKFSNSNKQINKLILSRFKYEINNKVNA